MLNQILCQNLKTETNFQNNLDLIQPINVIDGTRNKYGKNTFSIKI